jgi:antitoxin (DNA-binding transcriptional repressor) of toxin-antitoxin stability system
MREVGIQSAKTPRSRRVDDVVDVEEGVLAKAGKPLVPLVPLVEAQAARKMGLFAGEVWEATDCWVADDSALT